MLEEARFGHNHLFDSRMPAMRAESIAYEGCDKLLRNPTESNLDAYLRESFYRASRGSRLPTATGQEAMEIMARCVVDASDSGISAP